MSLKQTIKCFAFLSLLAASSFLFSSNGFTDTPQSNIGKAPDACASLTSDDPNASQGKSLSSLVSCQKNCRSKVCRKEKDAGGSSCYACLTVRATCSDIGAGEPKAAWCQPGGACFNSPTMYCAASGSNLGLQCVSCKPIPDQCGINVAMNTATLAFCQQNCVGGKCIFKGKYKAVNTPPKFVNCFACKLPAPPTCESLGWGTTARFMCMKNCPNGMCKQVKMTAGKGQKPFPGFTLNCFQCQNKPPLPGGGGIDEDLCHGAEAGECQSYSCPVNSECEDFSDMTASGESYPCHNCKELDSCQLHGYSADPTCGGQCADGDTCQSLDIDKDSGRVVPGGFTRAKGSTIPCYACKPNPNYYPRFCDKEGMWSEPTCNEKCPAGGDCTPLFINTKTHAILDEDKGTTDPVQKCYVCTSHKVNVEKSICTEEGYYIDETCDGKCPADSCNEENIDTQTGNEIPAGDPVDPDTSHVCYSCAEPREVHTSTDCPKEGYYSQASCDGKCPASDCVEKNIDSQSGEVIPVGYPVKPETSHVCYECKTHAVVNKLTCPEGSVYGNCPGSCSETQDCETTGYGCVKCSPKPVTDVKKKTCEDMGMSDGEDCVKSCSKKGGTCVPNSADDYGTKCWECKVPQIALHPCGTDGKLGQCPADCGADQDCVQLPGQCYQCKPKAKPYHPGGGFFAPPPCGQDQEGFCNDSSCPAGEECKSYTKQVGFESAVCHSCQSKYQTAPATCSKFDMSDDSTCGGKCTGSDTCEPMQVNKASGKLLGDGQTTTDPTMTCYACRQHSVVATPAMCSKLGYSNDATCDGKCPSSDCYYDYFNPTTGLTSSYYQSSLTNGIKCYFCRPDWKEEKTACNYKDYYYDDYCMDDCPPDACDAYYINKQTGKQVHRPFNPNDVYLCYDCIPYEEWQDRQKPLIYVIAYIEPIFERYVLGASSSVDPNAFTPTSVMALAKVDPGTNQISNVSGDLKAITSFVGGMNTGFSSGGGLATTGSVSLDQISGDLKQDLNSGGHFGANCFDNVLNQANAQAASAGTPTTQNISEGKMNDHDRGHGDEKSYGPDQIKASEDAGTPAVSGPVLVCGNQKGEKVLEILDGSGNLIAAITQEMFRQDPNIIQKKLYTAQGWTDKQSQKAGFFAAQAPGTVAPSNTQDNVPNDPLYPKPKAEKKKSGGLFAALFAPDSSNVPVNINGAMQSQTANMVNNGDGVTDQYYLPLIGYTPLSDPNSAWNVFDVTQKNVVVAIVDSGLDLSHPDAPQYLWVNPKNGSHGWNFVNENNNDFTDYRGHGTFVAGIIAARWNNGIGIAGINPGAVIMPVKVTDDKGKTNSLQIFRGINFALDHGARIINVSLGGVGISKLEQQAIARAHAMGALVVIAAGNTSDDLMRFGPSSSKYALSVGMVDIGGKRSLVSSWGASLGLMGPGEKIISLCSKDAKDVLPSVKKFGYYKESGTSFTAPMVTATASLILARNPQWTGEQIADMIKKTAKPIDQNDWDDHTGFGLLNASAALRASVDDHLLVMITNMHYNHDRRDRLTSLDVYGTVRGPYKELTIEAGKGKMPSGFRKIAGPFQGQYDNQLIARLILQDSLRGSDEWVLRLKVTDEQGKEHNASTSFTFPGK